MGGINISEYFFELVKSFGDFGIFILLILEFIGAPVPGEPLMTFMGYVAWENNTSVWVTLIYAILGTNIGSTIAYLIGYKYGDKFFVKYGKYFFISEKKVEKTKEIMKKYEVVLLIFSRYVPGVRHVVPYLCGISKLSFKEFTKHSFIGSVIWCSSFIFSGYLLGENWDKIDEILIEYSWIIVLIALFVFLVYKFFNKNRYRIFSLTFLMSVFGGLTWKVSTKGTWALDGALKNYFSRFYSEKLNFIIEAITNIGSVLSITTILVGVYTYVLIKKKPIIYANMAVINVLLVWGTNEILKQIFVRVRPDSLTWLSHVSGYSFPSGHAMVSSAFFGLFVYYAYVFINNKLRKYTVLGLLSGLIISIGLSRIYLGVHYESDVLAGFCVGITWVISFVAISKKLKYL